MTWFCNIKLYLSLYYLRYNKLSREIRDLAVKIRDLEPKDPFRIEATSRLLEKLYLSYFN